MGAAVASESFWCKRFKCTLAERACVARQEADPLEGLKGHVVDDRLEYCRSGDCRQGNEIAARLTRIGKASPAAAKAIAEAVEEEARGGWPDFQARKEGQRAAAAEDAPPEPEPHVLSDRGILAAISDHGEPCARAGAGCPQKIDPGKNRSGLCRWCSRGVRIGSPSHGILPNSDTRNLSQKIRRSQKGPGLANAPAGEAPRVVREPKVGASLIPELKRMEIILREIEALSPEGRTYLAATLVRQR